MEVVDWDSVVLLGYLLQLLGVVLAVRQIEARRQVFFPRSQSAFARARRWVLFKLRLRTTVGRDLRLGWRVESKEEGRRGEPFAKPRRPNPGASDHEWHAYYDDLIRALDGRLTREEAERKTEYDALQRAVSSLRPYIDEQVAKHLETVKAATNSASHRDLNRAVVTALVIGFGILLTALPPAFD